MARPIEVKPVPRDAREETQRKLDAAPLEHAEALLSAYKLLQQLHESGALDLARGALGAGDKLLDEAVSLLTQPEAMRGVRNLLLLGKLLGSVDPAVLHGVVKAIPSGSKEKPPSLFKLLRRMSSVESRRGLSLAVAMLEGLGGGPTKR